MKNPNIILYVLVIVLSLSTSFLLIKKGTPTPPVMEPCDEKAKGKTKSNSSDFRQIFYDSYSSIILPNEGLAINKNSLIQDTTFHPIELKNKINGKTLVFRYSSADCEECINMVISQLEALKLKIPSVIITDSYSDLDFLVKTRHQGTSLNIFSLVGDKKLGLPLEGKNIPFLFLTDDKHLVSHFYTPYKEFPDQLSEYLRFIEGKINAH